MLRAMFLILLIFQSKRLYAGACPLKCLSLEQSIVASWNRDNYYTGLHVISANVVSYFFSFFQYIFLVSAEH